MRFAVLFVISLSLSWSYVRAQKYEVEGQVINAEEKPVPSVTLKVKGTNIETQTSESGFFRFEVDISDEKILSLSSLGYVDKEVSIVVDKLSLWKIILDKEIRNLDEVTVSTGYESIPKERATGSFSVIDNDLFNRQMSTDVISRLDGLVPGLYFDKRKGNNQTFQIRGISTLAAPNTGLDKPLIILDNFPYEGDINNINPNDVENITFLKDAAASSIWGAKAGNGVVVITTKRASYNQRFKLTVTSNLTLSEKPDLWYPSQMSTSDYIDTEIFLFGKGAYNANLNNNTSRPVITPVVEILAKMRSGELLETDAMEQIDRLRNIDIRDDYDRYFYRKAFKQQYSLNLTGGNEGLSYLLSTGLDRDLTSLKENEFDRFSIRSINTIKPVRNLELGLGITYSQSNTQINNSAPFDLGGGRNVYPYARLADDNGEPVALPQNYRASFVESVGDGKLLDWKYYPLAEIYQRDNTTKNSSLFFNTSINYGFLTWLNADFKYNYQNQHVYGRSLRSDDLFSTRNIINRFTIIDIDKITRKVPTGSILDESNSILNAHNLRGQLNISRNFSTVHKLHGIVGGEIRHSKIENSANTLYGYDDYLKISSQIDYVNRYPIFGNLASNQTIPYRNTNSASINRFLSVYANASYNYLNRYTISGSARRDASNLFGVNTNNKWKPLWSIGGKWDVSKESFYRSGIVPSLSIRTTYGYSGNVNNSIPAVVTINYLPSLSPLGRNVYANLRDAPNSNLRWENVGQLNLAVDFGLKNGILSGYLEYYDKSANDLIYPVNSDPTTGFSLLNLNSAIVQNKGIELSLNSFNVIREFTWNSKFNISINNNVLKKSLLEVFSYSTIVQGGMVPPLDNYPLNSLFSYKWAGLHPESGDPLGYEEAEVSSNYIRLNSPLSIDELFFHGSLMPKVYGNLMNTLSFRGVSVSFNVTGQFSYYFRRNSINYAGLLSENGMMGHGDYALRWKQSGDERKTNVPSIIYPSNSNRDRFYQYSQATVERGDHVRLQDININYLLTDNNSKILKNCRFSFYANNLNWVIWKATKMDLDPMYNNMVPAIRNMTLGFTTNF